MDVGTIVASAVPTVVSALAKALTNGVIRSLGKDAVEGIVRDVICDEMRSFGSSAPQTTSLSVTLSIGDVYAAIGHDQRFLMHNDGAITLRSTSAPQLGDAERFALAHAEILRFEQVVAARTRQ